LLIIFLQFGSGGGGGGDLNISPNTAIPPKNLIIANSDKLKSTSLDYSITNEMNDG